MGTRSNIMIETMDKEVKKVYAHWDGYLECNGALLEKYYNSYEKALELVSFGDISSLKENSIPPNGSEHSFSNALNDVTVYYGRDRGEDGVDCRTHKDYAPLNMGEEFIYLFRNGKWYYKSIGMRFFGMSNEGDDKEFNEQHWKDLREALKEIGNKNLCIDDDIDF